jgi:Cu/Ag efflux protein CusF
MKTTLFVSALAMAGVVSTPSLAASDHGSHGSMVAQSQSPSSNVMADGVVKKVDKAAGKVTLSHGPLANLGMTTPMTMVFRVKDAAWLDQMKEGDKIRFMADNVNGAMTVVHFEAAK